MMYLLLYYNDKDCQITLLRPVFFRREQAKAALKEKTIEYLKQQGCGCAEKLFQKAQKEQGYCIDDDSQIEINVEEFEAYIKTENQSPYFATFQILFTGSTGLAELDFTGRGERNEKAEKLFKIFSPVLTVLGTADIFPTKTGYSVRYVDTQQGSIWQTRLVNGPGQAAKELLRLIKYGYCYLLGVDSMLPDTSDYAIEDFEYVMPHIVKAPYKAFVKSMERSAEQVLAGNSDLVPESLLGDRRIRNILCELVSYIRSCHGLLQLKEKHIYEDYIEKLIRIYKEKYGRVYLGTIRADKPEVYTEYTGSERISEYEFFIPYADQETLELLVRWRQENTDKALSYYYQMHERFFLKGGIWYGWNF